MTVFYASPILADGRIYMLDRSGTMHILKPGREMEVLGQSVLGEEASATPAVVGDSIYIRGIKKSLPNRSLIQGTSDNLR